MGVEVRRFGTTVDVADGEVVVARGAVSGTGAVRDLEIDASGARDPASVVRAALPALLDMAGAGPEVRRVRWWVSGPDADTDRIADDHGLTERRDLHQLRRPLPLDDRARDGRPTTPTRPLRLRSADEEAVVEVNNRAFAWHPDQANRTVEWIRAAAREPWFDPDGFLVHETDGAIDGFCWTKVHAEERPPVGEIFVIGVDPAAHGRGLGRGLTVAGLDHLAGRGLTTAMLYVEAANATALALYDRLGFDLHQVRRAYQGVPPAPGPQS